MEMFAMYVVMLALSAAASFKIKPLPGVRVFPPPLSDVLCCDRGVETLHLFILIYIKRNV
jgi:hypothetical protein